MIKQRIKGKDNETIGYMVADVVGNSLPFNNFISIGISLCHKKDKFNKGIGEVIAIKRMCEYEKTYKFRDTNTPYRSNMGDQLNSFVFRCNRYYKDKCVILPKVEFVVYE